VFWPDLASSHYDIRVQEYLKSNKICYVPKWCNPANCPKLRTNGEISNKKCMRIAGAQIT